MNNEIYSLKTVTRSGDIENMPLRDMLTNKNAFLNKLQFFMHNF